MSPADLAFGLLAVSRGYFPAASCLALPASNHSSVTAEYVWCFSSATRLSAFTRAGGSMHMNLTCPVGFRGIEPGCISAGLFQGRARERLEPQWLLWLSSSGGPSIPGFLKCFDD